jgi:CubicO group peptidase (beta-lactamase class C family)
VYTPADDGRFAYGGGHMQQHAVLMNLGALDNAGLAAEIQNVLGNDIGMSYSQPQLAGGVVSTAADYAVFLRKLLNGSLQIAAMLGSHPVCTNPLTCTTAINTPVPSDESWHYSLGHWVEDDPLVGDGSFSSAGAFGFYPWVDANKTTYGIIAREAATGAGADSVYCGRLIRKAWMSAVAQ